MEFLIRQRAEPYVESDRGEPAKHAEDGEFDLNESVLVLQSLWRSEVTAPEVLPYNEALVEEIKGALQQQQEFIDAKIQEKNPDEYFTINLYLMDIERIRFLLVNYLRTRMRKIERHAAYITGTVSELEKLSEAEERYLAKLSNLNNQHAEDVITSRLAPRLQRQFKDNNDFYDHARPNLEKFVFVQTIIHFDELQLDDKTMLQGLEAGNILVAQYKAVQQHVHEGTMQLL